jgi:hypothetical protein
MFRAIYDRSRHMICDLQRMIALPIAVALFIFSAQASAGLMWRGSTPTQTVASR